MKGRNYKQMLEVTQKIYFDEVVKNFQKEESIDEHIQFIDKIDYDKNEVQQNADLVTRGVFEKYKASNIESDGEIVDRGDVWKKHIPLVAEVIDEKVPLTLFVMKSFTKENDNKSESVNFILIKGMLEGNNTKTIYKSWREARSAGNLIGNMEFVDNGNYYDLKDREVDPRFRKQGFASVLLDASESFVQESAVDKMEAETAFVDVAQLDVIVWLLNKGYKPQTQKDQERLELVLNGDKSLELGDKYYVFRNVPAEDKVINLPSGRKIPNRHKAFRIKLVKEITPDLERSKQNLKTDTKLEINKIIN